MTFWCFKLCQSYLCLQTWVFDHMKSVYEFWFKVEFDFNKPTLVHSLWSFFITVSTVRVECLETVMRIRFRPSCEIHICAAFKQANLILLYKSNKDCTNVSDNYMREIPFYCGFKSLWVPWYKCSSWLLVDFFQLIQWSFVSWHTIGQNTMCNMKGIAFSDELLDNYHHSQQFPSAPSAGILAAITFPQIHVGAMMSNE